MTWRDRSPTCLKVCCYFSVFLSFFSRYRVAADQGSAGAQNNLGVCYQHGVGVGQDDREAVRWWVFPLIFLPPSETPIASAENPMYL